MAADPFDVFGLWYRSAQEAGEVEPEAMALATAGRDGRPSVRFVLLRRFDAAGLVFYTNGESRKGRELEANPAAAAVLRWASCGRQVRATGSVSQLRAEESDDYFSRRSRGSQLGAWASLQSRPLESRAELDRRVAEAAERFAGEAVSRPPWWGGYRLVPDELEFWQQGEDRLHDRFLYSRSEGSPWRVRRLFP